MADSGTARSVSGEMMAGRRGVARASAEPTGVPTGDWAVHDVIDVDYIEVSPEFQTSISDAQVPHSAARTPAGLAFLQRGNGRSQSGRTRGGPLFWLAGSVAVIAAFWVAGGHSALGPGLVAAMSTQEPDLRIDNVRSRAGMVAGQAFDIAAETAPEPLDLAAITGLQGLKTGALIGWAAESGAILGRSDPEPMRRYAADLGLAFQIRDDLLDHEGDPSAAGKRLRKDAAANKATFVSLLGVEGARAKARDLADRACDALSPYGSAAETLRQAAQFVVARAA